MLTPQMERLVKFALERENIRVAKEAGSPAPWTDDKILQTFRFCNVHREDDAVTKWIAAHWRREGVQHLWFWMLMARLFNKPSTLGELDSPVASSGKVFKPETCREVLKGVQTPFNAAYIVSTNGVSKNKIDYLIDDVLIPAWKKRDVISPIFQGQYLMDCGTALMDLNGISGFIAGQIIADCKQLPPLSFAHDYDEFALSGPGSRRGLNRLLGHPADSSWKEASWKARLLECKDIFEKASGLGVCAQDFQNCLCEFDKYERARTQEGRPKQLYRGGK